MKLYDGTKIIIGLLLFLAIITYPVWYNAATGKAEYRPEIVVATENEPGRDDCVREASFMRTDHMNLLNQWRDEVVREGGRYIAAADDREYEMSLSNTCMDCHSNKADFCDQCHNFMAVDPYCWNCHVEPSQLPTELAAEEVE